MATPITYRRHALPAAELTPASFIPHFTTQRRLAVPGLLIPNTGLDHETAVERLQLLLGKCGAHLVRSMGAIRIPQADADIVLHIDSFPDDKPEVMMVAQYTEKGGAEVETIRVADPFCNELRKRKAAGRPPYPTEAYYLPRHTDTLLNEGLVDPDILEPDVYVGAVAAGGMVLFTIGGPNPIAHRITTTTPERQAQGYVCMFTRL